MKLAIVHDTMNVYGGAEKVLEELHLLYPDAPIFTAIHDPRVFPAERNWKVKTSFLQRVPGISRVHRAAFFAYPFAMSALNLDAFDVVLSSSFNFAHHVSLGPNTRHICYCHSPARFLWDPHGYARREEFGFLPRQIHRLAVPPLRALDRSAAQGVDTWISTSRLVRDRISKYYRRESVIIPPPIDTRAFPLSPPPRDGYLLMIMRLVRWKRPDIVIEACNRLGLRLVVAGDGREARRLTRMAGSSIEFVGRVDGAEKARLYAGASALILPSIEDFGITPIEAMAVGRPVIAVRAGGALDTVVPGVTGEFFERQTPESLMEVLRRFDPGAYDATRIRAHAEGFDREVFRARIADEVRDFARVPAATKPVPSGARPQIALAT
ncbi:MAG: glycosyl transferase [Rhodovulum sulfidophilum]|uniref:Glycosyl transferase n=1 Tax=Rhodovulum sulfidophilum TaxID=35806 RepID=A0A2W5NBA4_RHOSU|nr:MAG: glycosyl transferase [Rhodovulum sulfidophilum]